MARVVSILLLTCMILPWFSSGTYWHLKELWVEQKAKEHLRSSHLEDHYVVLSFSSKDMADLRWEHEKEFEYKGTMFDVVSICEDRDGYHITCWKDEEESQLKESMATSSQQNRERYFLAMQFTQPFLISDYGPLIAIDITVIPTASFHQPKTLYSNPGSQPELPPPQPVL